MKIKMPKIQRKQKKKREKRGERYSCVLSHTIKGSLLVRRLTFYVHIGMIENFHRQDKQQ